MSIFAKRVLEIKQGHKWVQAQGNEMTFYTDLQKALHLLSKDYIKNCKEMEIKYVVEGNVSYEYISKGERLKTTYNIELQDQSLSDNAKKFYDVVYDHFVNNNYDQNDIDNACIENTLTAYQSSFYVINSKYDSNLLLTDNELQAKFKESNYKNIVDFYCDEVFNRAIRHYEAKILDN